MLSLKWLVSTRSDQEASKPKFLELRSSRWFITFVVSFASATDIFMYGLIVPVTPTALHTRLGFSDKNVQAWTTILLALFGGALLISSPIVGYIADRSESRKWHYLCGLAGLGAATALICVGTNIGFWIAGRVFQGVAAVTVWVVGNALLADTVGQDGVGEALGYVVMAISIGTVAGPLLGGVVYEKCGYYAVFGLAFGLIGFDILLRLALVERRHAIQWIENEDVSSRTELVPSVEHFSGNNAATDGPEGLPTAGINSIQDSAPPNASSGMTLGRIGILLSCIMSIKIRSR